MQIERHQENLICVIFTWLPGPGIHKTFLAQLFQPSATVATFWWASSLLIEYTEHQSHQPEIKEGPRSKSCDLDTKYMFYILLTLYCKTIIRHILSFQNLLPFLSCFHGPQFAPLPLTGLVVIIWVEEALFGKDVFFGTRPIWIWNCRH